MTRHGCVVTMLHQNTYRKPEYDVAVFYGLMRSILDGYSEQGLPAVYIDLGYFGRHEGGRREGFHKLALNARHPTAYFQKRKHDSSRFKHFNVPIQQWRGPKKGGYVLLAGMSAKAAAAEGFAPEEWERGIVNEIRRYTDRKIMYRPKPNWPGAQDIPETSMLPGTKNEGDVYHFLDNCHAVVTHHSNVAIEGLLHGVPVFCWDGVATAPGKAMKDISQIENPLTPIGREQWVWDIAWTQWSVPEMRSGDAWQHLKDEELVP